MRQWGRRISLIAGLAVGLAAVARGQLPEEEPPPRTVITANRLTFDYRRSIALFEGDVKVSDPELNLTSDSLTVIMNPDESIKSVTAVGNVHVVQGDRTARGDKVIYILAQGEVVITGHAQLQRGADLVKGNVITIWVGEDRMVCEPGTLILRERP